MYIIENEDGKCGWNMGKDLRLDVNHFFPKNFP